MEQSGFLYIDLQALTAGKPFSGFAIGDYVDMFGREVSLKAKDLQAFIDNTLKQITAFKNKNMPGLPIDAKSHDKGEAAGWITGAELSEVKNSNGDTIPTIQFTAEWTELGTDLLEKKIQANFSPTVDINNKVIIGGSLTNWPATIDDNGVPLFEAIELAQGMTGLNKIVINSDDESENIKGAGDDTPPEIEVNMDELNEVKTQLTELSSAVQALAEIVKAPAPQTVDESAGGDDIMQVLENATDKEEMAELAKQYYKGQYVALRKEAQRQAANEIALAKKQGVIADLCQELTGGTEATPRGIPVHSNDLSEFLNRLPSSDLEFATKMLRTIQRDGLTQYGELGHGKALQQLKSVPDAYVKGVEQTMANGHDVQTYFDLAELGNASDYDLTQFGGK